MAVFRIERTRDYTVMSNHHLRNGKLSLKAKGLLSMMLSLPEDWNYTTRGLAAICKEGVDAIGGALRELEAAGYIVRHQLRDRQGRISDTEYVIYEQPQPKNPDTPQPDTASPDTGNPDMEKPDTEKPAELNIEKSNTQKSITHGSSTDSIPFRETAAASPPERKGRDAMSLTEMESYRDLILENIEYDYLCREFATYREDLDEIVELMVETVCAKRKTTRIAGSDFPHEVVRSRFLKLDSEHIRFVMDSLQKNTTEVRNMKQYLLTVLFNAPTTISNHYTSQVNHDMNAGGWYLSEHGISNLDELDAALSSVSDRAYSIREGMKTAEQRMKELQKLIENGENYLQYKPIHAELKKLKNGWTNKRDKYEEAHRAELTLWNAASRYLHANLTDTKTLPISKWKHEYADLKEQRDTDYTKLKATRAEVAELQKIRKCVDIALKAEQPEQTQNHTKRQEQER